ncbi:MAG: hypothetical protein KF862_11550 [Chitinophagaceae bacterium]|nr:hypothetical protein [Chitinophagaceae bacterium]
MNSLENIYSDFIKRFQSILVFIVKNFGTKSILIKKNKRLIPERNLSIKDSNIKGYVFHGSGCQFIFKNLNVDIEFNNDNIGFTEWGFYRFVESEKFHITEEEVNSFLLEKVKNNELAYDGKIYVIK